MTTNLLADEATERCPWNEYRDSFIPRYLKRKRFGWRSEYSRGWPTVEPLAKRLRNRSVQQQVGKLQPRAVDRQKNRLNVLPLRIYLIKIQPKADGISEEPFIVRV